MSMRAWDVASGMGLGRDRTPFRVIRTAHLSPSAKTDDGGWPLSLAALSSDDVPNGGCTLHFDAPLRLVERRHLIEAPTIRDIAMACVRRVEALSGRRVSDEDGSLLADIISEAERLPTETFVGRKSDLVRWSGSQGREIDMRGVCGSLRMPEGCGALLPLMLAAEWMHIGKGTVFGLGEVEVDE